MGRVEGCHARRRSRGRRLGRRCGTDFGDWTGADGGKRETFQRQAVRRAVREDSEPIDRGSLGVVVRVAAVVGRVAAVVGRVVLVARAMLVVRVLVVMLTGSKGGGKRE